MKKKQIEKIVIVLIIACLFALLYATYHTYGNWSFALPLRAKKLWAFVLVGCASAVATVAFQTLTNNTLLTPSILGFDSIYIFMQTLLFFFTGSFFRLQQNPLGLFLLSLLLMVGVATVLFSSLLKIGKHNLFLVLMVGIIIGTFFNSSSTFLQVIMNPNEYDKLQGKLFASFANIETVLLPIATLLLGLVLWWFWSVAFKLDIIHLGRDQAQSLGIDFAVFQKQLLLAISFLMAISTALVGPITFLGFIVANLSYQFFATYQHRTLFIGASLLSIILLILGQFLVEQVFQFRTTQSILIEFIGGCYFLGRLLKQSKVGSEWR